jgi:hypothetical protein
MQEMRGYDSREDQQEISLGDNKNSTNEHQDS